MEEFEAYGGCRGLVQRLSIGLWQYTLCEFMWVKQFLEELRFVVKLLMDMHCDNQAVIHIAFNLVFRMRNKHIKVYCHLVHERVEKGVNATPFVFTRAQLDDMFTKLLCKLWLGLMCNKLGLPNIYSPS